MNERYIVCVDDEAIITVSLKQELRAAFPSYKVESALSAMEALELMKELLADGDEPAVLVTDERMPGMNGHELMVEARKILPNLYSILLTGYTDIEALAVAINQAGLFRYIKKPWDRNDLALAVGKALSLYEAEREVRYLRSQVEKLNLAIVSALENSAHEDDPATYGHVQRVAFYATILARALGLEENETRRIRLYAPLHDIGKSGIPHDILTKPARLDPQEFETIKQHVAIGERILSSIDVDPLARDIILYHHEHWDGDGYLAKLKGEEIPLAARIVAVADVVDAMLSPRPYKDALPFEEVIRYVNASAGTHFDPAVVTAFNASSDEIRAIASGNRSIAEELAHLYDSVPELHN